MSINVNDLVINNIYKIHTVSPVVLGDIYIGMKYLGKVNKDLARQHDGNIDIIASNLKATENIDTNSEWYYIFSNNQNKNIVFNEDWISDLETLSNKVLRLEVHSITDEEINAILSYFEERGIYSDRLTVTTNIE